jgi:hypothetical protein
MGATVMIFGPTLGHQPLLIALANMHTRQLHQPRDLQKRKSSPCFAIHVCGVVAQVNQTGYAQTARWLSKVVHKARQYFLLNTSDQPNQPSLVSNCLKTKNKTLS